MTTNETPWTGLATGAIDARRVDRSGDRDFFWWLSEDDTPALLLRMTVEMEKRHPLPKVAGLDIRYRDIPGGEGLVIRLRELEQIDIFETLCRDVVAAGEAGGSEQDALDRSIRRTLRWHHLLRAGHQNQLSLEEQRGLIGELHCLRRLVELIGARAAIEAWKGPEGAAKDFELPNCCLEVKARRGAARPHVQIASEDQLADVPGSSLFLRICEVNAAISPDGKSLTEHVREADSIFRHADMMSHAIWEVSLAAAGFDFDDDYSERHWTVGRVMHFRVGNGFPRITTPVPEGITGVRYSISIEACRSFELPEAEVEAILMHETADD